MMLKVQKHGSNEAVPLMLLKVNQQCIRSCLSCYTTLFKGFELMVAVGMTFIRWTAIENAYLRNLI